LLNLISKTCHRNGEWLSPCLASAARNDRDLSLHESSHFEDDQQAPRCQSECEYLCLPAQMAELLVAEGNMQRRRVMQRRKVQLQHALGR
jgi:hypothetical protein